MTEEISAERVATAAHAANESPLNELLAFERLLADLSARFANVAGEQVESEIAGALKQLIHFLGCERSTFGELTADGWLSVLCSVAVEGVEPFPSGPLSAFWSWYVDRLRAGKIIALRTPDELPPEAIDVAEYFRRSGVRSQLGIPLSVGGRVVGAITFVAFRATRTWPDVARIKIAGEVIAQALARKRSEAVLRSSEERWRLAFESSTVGIFLAGQDLRYLSANPAFQAIVGYTEEELRRLSPLDLIFENDQAACRRITEFQQGEHLTFRGERQYRRKDGKPVWVLLNVSTLPASSSERRIHFGTAIDITERKAAAASLEELLAFERLLADLSVRFANISGAEVESEITSALKKLLVFLGSDRCTFTEFTPEGWVNVLCSVAVEGMEPFPSGPLPDSFKWFVDQARAGKIIAVGTFDDLPPEATGEAEHFRSSGLRSYLRIPVAVGGRIVGGISFSAIRSARAWPDDLIARLKIVGEVIAQALTRSRSEAALAASEARWRSVFETSILGISLTDQNLDFLAANAAFQRMLGYTAEELQALSALDLSFDDDREVARTLLLELQQGKRQHYDIVKQYRRKDGTPIWGHSYVSTMSGGDSQPPLFLATTMDITDRKRAEDALRATQSELARVTRFTTMGEMTASIAHEVNQPLAAIVANANAGLRWLGNATPDTGEVRAVLKRIVADGHRASEVIAGIRAMFKQDTHDKDKARLDANELVREILALVQGELQTRGVSARTRLTSELPKVLGNRVQLQQVLLNLIMNAVEAMAPVTGRARVLRMKSERHAPDGVLVSVEDSGTGIDRKNIDRIFEAFFTTKPHGMGMGLSICRSIIQAHGGRLSASPGHPHGSVFQVFLPAAGPGGD